MPFVAKKKLFLDLTGIRRISQIQSHIYIFLNSYLLHLHPLESGLYESYFPEQMALGYIWMHCMSHTKHFLRPNGAILLRIIV